MNLEEDLINIDGEGEMLVDRWAVDQNEFARKKKTSRKSTRTARRRTKKTTYHKRWICLFHQDEEHKKRIQKHRKTYKPMTEEEAKTGCGPVIVSPG